MFFSCLSMLYYKKKPHLCTHKNSHTLLLNPFIDNPPMQKFFIAIASVVLLLFTSCNQSVTQIDLSGEWQVSLDFPDSQPFAIGLPGTTDQAGLGVADTLLPLLQKPQVLRLTRRHSFVGEAFYSRMFEIPKSMVGQPLELTLERVLWKSSVWIDGQLVSPVEQTDVSLTTPHLYMLPQGLAEGRHKIQICVDNRKQYDISVDELCHSYTDATQVKWNGILGRMELRALPKVSIDRIEVYPNSALTQLDVVIHVTNHTQQLQETYYSLFLSPKSSAGFDDILRNTPASETLSPGASVLNASIKLPSSLPKWSELNPELLDVSAMLEADGAIDEKTVQFGLRNVAASDGKILVNGEPVFLRGSLECCIFPLTGCPPCDDEGWRKVFTSAREWGLNHLRFHSWCPPDAAFRVADEMGFYLSVELPIWQTNLGKDSTRTQFGTVPNDDTYGFLRAEYENIVRNYGNHPSFLMLSCGNELQYDFVFLNEFVAEMKQRDPRHLYTTTSFTFEKGHGGHNEPEDQYFVTQWTE